MDDLTPEEAKRKLRARMKKLGLDFSFVYVPPTELDVYWRRWKLRWKYTLRDARGKTALEGVFSAGIGHAPSYKHALGEKITLDQRDALQTEVISGRHAKTHKPILPEITDVFSSLLLDGGAIDNPTYEDWASEYGYDADSRKGEATYRACLETGLKLRALLGESVMEELRELANQM